jgi:hypothetical protein
MLVTATGLSSELALHYGALSCHLHKAAMSQPLYDVTMHWSLYDELICTVVSPLHDRVLIWTCMKELLSIPFMMGPV